jgi:hypothetical protein
MTYFKLLFQCLTRGTEENLGSLKVSGPWLVLKLHISHCTTNLVKIILKFFILL